MQRPFVGAANHDRRNACGLQRLHRAEQVIPCLDLRGIDIGLGHQFLVVEETDLRQRDRKAVDAAVLREGGERRRGDGVAVALHLIGDVFENAGLDLSLQHAAGPAIDDVRPILRLQDGRQLRLVGLVLEELHLDLDAGMRRFVGAGNLLPDLHLGRIHLDMEPFHGGVGGGGPDGEGQSRGGDQQPFQQSHEVLPSACRGGSAETVAKF